jgi:hypothetical protein
MYEVDPWSPLLSSSIIIYAGRSRGHYYVYIQQLALFITRPTAGKQAVRGILSSRTKRKFSAFWFSLPLYISLLHTLLGDGRKPGRQRQYVGYPFGGKPLKEIPKSARNGQDLPSSQRSLLHTTQHHFTPLRLQVSTAQSSGVSFVTGDTQSQTQESQSAYDDEDEGYVEVDLPEHSCAYCGICDPASVEGIQP